MKVRRLNLDVPVRTRERLESLLCRTKFGSIRALICKALEVYEDVLLAAWQGDKIIVQRKDGRETELFIPL